MTTQSAALPRSVALAGIGLMLVGIFFFALNDALGKWLISNYSLGQLLQRRRAGAFGAIHLA
jgi:hypothetical protein